MSLIMMNLKIIVFVLSVHHCIGHLRSPENDSLDTSGPGNISVTSGQLSGSLQNILNQESLVKFAMVQTIQRLVLDVAEVKSDFKDWQRKLVDIQDELHSLKTIDQGLEKENAGLKQTLQAIYARHPIDELASVDIEGLKNETVLLTTKYDNLLLENNAFRNQLSDMNGQMKKIDNLSARLHIVEDGMQNVFLSMNASIENIREDLNTSCTPPAQITESSGVLSGSRGKEFLILFMRNYRYAKGSPTIYLASDSGTTANLSSSPKLDATIRWEVDKILDIAVDSKFTLPSSLTCKYGKVEPKAVILQTLELSTVTIFDSSDTKSNDATLIIPTNKLSKKYVVSSTQPYSSAIDKSQFAVGALYDGTNINITFKMKNKSPLSLLGRTYTDGEALSLTLERLETFQVGHTTDLSGTVITSSKPVVVFSGNRCQELKVNGCSHMLTQLPPVSELDNQYIVPPFYNNAGTLVQVISESETSVNCSVGDRVSTWLLGETEYKNVKVSRKKIGVLVSDRPVLVTAFGMGKPYHPYMTVIPGVHQYLNYYKIVVPDGYNEDFLCVIILSESLQSLRINGYTVDHYENVYQRCVVVKKKFQVSIIKVHDGSFELTALDKSNFGLLVYGHRNSDGYGFAGNFVLN